MSGKPVTFEAEVVKDSWKHLRQARYNHYLQGPWLARGASEWLDNKSPLIQAAGSLKPGYKQRVEITVRAIGEPVKGVE